MNKKIHIIGGGTVFHVRPHLALCSPAYGTVAKNLAILCHSKATKLDTHLHLTKMALGPISPVKVLEDQNLISSLAFNNMYGYENLETNEDISNLIDKLTDDPDTKIIFLTAALCDYKTESSDKYGERLKTDTDKNVQLNLIPAEKIVAKIRKKRKDIFAVAFKTTCGATADEQYIAGLHLLKSSSVNLVLANDVKTRLNMIITPEEARYCETTNREEVLNELIDMTIKRSHLTFTRSTVVAGDCIPWNSEEIPESLRTVVDYCIEKNAYKPFRGSTVGHFATKINDTTFLTSIRKSNFNDLQKNGLVKIVTDGPDSVLAYGAKPSVGGQSQRIVFEDHKEYDCILHFHCPIKESSAVPQVSQKEYECGSHECGRNTSKGLKKFGNLSAVYLQEHGPNIVFNKSIDPQEVIDFIEDNFDLDKKTGGYVELPKRNFSTMSPLKSAYEDVNLTQEEADSLDHILENGLNYVK